MSIKVLHSILDDNLALIQLTRKGIEYPLFAAVVASTNYSLKDWSSMLHLTERTLQRYKKEEKTFEQLYSERILAIFQLQLRGIEVFGNVDYFNKWMDSNIVALGGVKPKTFLDSALGIEMLSHELTRIEHGIFA